VHEKKGFCHRIIMPERVLCICIVCRAKNPNGLSVSRATRTRHMKQDRERLQWSSVQSATLVNNFYVITSQDDTSSEQHLIADQESFHSEYLELIEDEIEEEKIEKESDGEEDGDVMLSLKRKFFVV
jgi:hypothetical protein